MSTTNKGPSNSGMATFLGIVIMSLAATYLSAVAISFSSSVNMYKKAMDSNFKRDIFETELRLALTRPLIFPDSATITEESQEIKMRDQASGVPTPYIKSGTCYRDYLILKIEVKESRSININSVRSIIGYLNVLYQIDPGACASADPMASRATNVTKNVARVPMFFVLDQAKLAALPVIQSIVAAYSTNPTTVSVSNTAICNTGEHDLANCKSSHEKQCELYRFTDQNGNDITKYFDPTLRACMPRETWTRE